MQDTEYRVADRILAALEQTVAEISDRLEGMGA